MYSSIKKSGATGSVVSRLYSPCYWTVPAYSIGDGRPLVLAGPSGSGKSTLLKRLFVEFEGEVGLSVSRESCV